MAFSLHSVILSISIFLFNVLQQFAKPILIMGADVNHPSAGDTAIPSLAAVVGSLDPTASKYAVEVRAQEHRKEIIEDLKQITV